MNFKKIIKLPWWHWQWQPNRFYILLFEFAWKCSVKRDKVHRALKIKVSFCDIAQVPVFRVKCHQYFCQTAGMHWFVNRVKFKMAGTLNVIFFLAGLLSATLSLMPCLWWSFPKQPFRSYSEIIFYGVPTGKISNNYSSPQSKKHSMCIVD